jgi:hypothetical protein
MMGYDFFRFARLFFTQSTHGSKARKGILLYDFFAAAAAFTNEGDIETYPFPPFALRLPTSRAGTQMNADDDDAL